jgi:hypothetical protein
MAPFFIAVANSLRTPPGCRRPPWGLQGVFHLAIPSPFKFLALAIITPSRLDLTGDRYICSQRLS